MWLNFSKKARRIRPARTSLPKSTNSLGLSSLDHGYFGIPEASCAAHSTLLKKYLGKSPVEFHIGQSRMQPTRAVDQHAFAWQMRHLSRVKLCCGLAAYALPPTRLGSCAVS